MDEDSLFIFIIEVLGTIAFAISGIRLAAAKKFRLVRRIRRRPRYGNRRRHRARRPAGSPRISDAVA